MVAKSKPIKSSGAFATRALAATQLDRLAGERKACVLAFERRNSAIPESELVPDIRWSARTRYLLAFFVALTESCSCCRRARALASACR